MFPFKTVGKNYLCNKFDFKEQQYCFDQYRGSVLVEKVATAVACAPMKQL